MKNNLARSFGRMVMADSSKDWRIQIVQHVLSGAIATATHFIVMWLALSAQLILAWATTIGSIVGATARLFFSYIHVFEPKKAVVNALPHFVLA